MLTVPAFGMLRRGRGDPARPRSGFDAAAAARGRLRMADDDQRPRSPFRILPRLTDRNRGVLDRRRATGELRFLRCQDCGYYIHPPTPICPMCHSKDLGARGRCSGRATLYTYSVNHQPWMPGPELPFVVAIVDDPRAGRPAPHDQHRQLRARRRRDRHAGRGSRSSTTPTGRRRSASRCSSRTRTRTR